MLFSCCGQAMSASLHTVFAILPPPLLPLVDGLITSPLQRLCTARLACGCHICASAAATAAHASEDAGRDGRTMSGCAVVRKSYAASTALAQGCRALGS